MPIVLAPNPSQAFTAGKTYDKTNIQEIKDNLIPQMKNWIEKDGWVLRTGEFDFEVKYHDAFIHRVRLKKRKEVIKFIVRPSVR